MNSYGSNHVVVVVGYFNFVHVDLAKFGIKFISDKGNEGKWSRGYTWNLQFVAFRWINDMFD